MSDDEKIDDDEYHFAPEGEDYSSLMSESQTTPSESAPAETKPKKSVSTPNISKILETIQPVLEIVKQNFVVRISLIVIVVLLCGGVIYKCTAGHLVEKRSEKIAPVVATYPKSSVPVARSNHVILKPQAKSHNTTAQQDNYRNLDKMQSDLQAQVNALSTQMSSLTSNVSNIAENLRALNNQLSQLAATVTNEAKLGSGLAEQMKQLQMKTVARSVAMQPPRLAQYFVQAMIPGRAWLVNTEGQTLTVTQGTAVPDYGVVRYVDTSNSQVLTSSGRTITYSLADS
ncbi:MAG: hypothetical protein NTU48_07685 [Legionellales bacterium]|nr:hypothetical protein [Legionellales bacterium]